MRPKPASKAEVDRRVAWIKENGRGLVAQKIADQLGCTRGSVYSMVFAYNLQIASDPRSRHKARKENYGEELFKVHARENWLV